MRPLVRKIFETDRIVIQLIDEYARAHGMTYKDVIYHNYYVEKIDGVHHDDE